MCFTNKQGIKIVLSIIETIKNNKDYLSELDGAIGDGDHGINMNKGFSMAEESLSEDTTMSEGFQILSNILITRIGGSMGPLYGNFFRGFYSASKDHDFIDSTVIGAMLDKGYENIKTISTAQVNDKTLIDVLDPATHAYHTSLGQNRSLTKALKELNYAAKSGWDSTKGMVAKVGRASRLMERSIGHYDAGATSTYLILKSFVETSLTLIDSEE